MHTLNAEAVPGESTEKIATLAKRYNLWYELQLNALYSK